MGTLDWATAKTMHLDEQAARERDYLAAVERPRNRVESPVVLATSICGR